MKVSIVNCFETYQIRVEAVYDFFIDEGHEVNVIQSSFSHMKKNYIKEKKENYIYIDVKSYKKNLSIKRLISHYKFSKDVIYQIEILKPDLVYVLVPPNSLVKDISKYKQNKNDIYLIFDIIDLWPETMPLSKFKKTKPFVFWRNLRNDYIKTADYVITECNLFQKYFKSNINKTETLYFVKDLNSNIDKSKTKKNRLNLCYLGSINNIIDIDTIGNIIKEISALIPVTVRIIGNGEKKVELIDVCRYNGAEVIDYGEIYDIKIKQEIFNICDFGLNIYKTTTLIGMTMKSIDYLTGGLPIINNIKGDTFDIVEKYKCGINYQPNSLSTSKINLKDGKENAVHVSKLYFDKKQYIDRMNDIVFKILKNGCE